MKNEYAELMITFILDTDILSLLQRHQTPKLLELWKANRASIAITVISVEEQFNGWISRLRRTKTPSEYSRISSYFASTIEMLSHFPILSMTESAVLRFHTLEKLKLNVAGNDLRIAAIALEAGATVITRNLRDFQRIPDLKAVDWTLQIDQ